MINARVVVVGAGEISNYWFPPLREEKVHVAAVVDINPDSAREKCKKFSIDAEVGNDLAEMLRRTRPDFVLDLTTPDAHCSVTCTALRAGCHVLGEKPMAPDIEQARKMVRTAEQSGKMYMVSQSRRWEINHFALRDMINEGAIGELTTLNCDFFIGAHFGGFRDEMKSPLILDMAIHHFDLARFFSRTDPLNVYAQEFNPKNSWYKGAAAANCIFEMSNGIVFTYRGSWCAESCHTSWNGDWRVTGDKGTLLYQLDQPPRGQAVAGAEGFCRPLRDIDVKNTSLKYTGMHAALREMLDFLRTGSKTQTECHDNIKSLAMVFAAQESSQKGSRVKINF